MVSLTTDEIADTIAYALDAYYKGRIKGEEQLIALFMGLIGVAAIDKAESVNMPDAFDALDFMQKCGFEA